jgi:uncharacterized membrane protein YjjP (DUF1212 family)
MTEAEKLVITKYDLLYEQRMTRVESSIENMYKTIENMDKNMREGFKELRTDFRWLVLIMIGGFTGLFGLMAHGFHWF